MTPKGGRPINLTRVADECDNQFTILFRQRALYLIYVVTCSCAASCGFDSATTDNLEQTAKNKICTH